MKCACGCGEVLIQRDKYKPIVRFVRGHNMRFQKKLFNQHERVSNMRKWIKENGKIFACLDECFMSYREISEIIGGTPQQAEQDFLTGLHKLKFESSDGLEGLI